MGWNGAMRSIVAAARAAERESRRRQREIEARQKHLQKLDELDRAAYEVEVYENYIDRITSVHKEVSQVINWQSILNDSPPTKPEKKHTAEKIAREKLQNHRPGFFTKLFGSVEKEIDKLKNSIESSILSDEAEYEKKIRDYNKDLGDWREKNELSRGVLNKNPKAFSKALEVFKSFSEIEELGSYLEFEVSEKNFVSCTVKVHSEDIIPKYSKSLLKSGKLSQKEIPKRRFHEIYQDYVCGVVLRVANEIFSVLPIEEIIVTVRDDVLDTMTGNILEQPILSVLIPRETICRLNMSQVDPSDSLKNFIHQIDFKKTQGFSAVKEVKLPSSDT